MSLNPEFWEHFQPPPDSEPIDEKIQLWIQIRVQRIAEDPKLIADQFGPDNSIMIAQNISAYRPGLPLILNDFNWEPELTTHLLDAVFAARAKKQRIRLARQVLKARNQASYLNGFGIEYILNKAGKLRASYKVTMRGGNILAGVLAHGGETEVGIMPLSAVGWKQAPNGQWSDKPVRIQLPPVALQALRDEGFAVSQGKTLLKIDSPAWRMLTRIFHNAIELKPYNHSLTAPMVPGSLLIDTDVVYCNIKDDTGTPLQSDGAGRYHPEHPMIVNMNRGNNYPTIQIRGLNPRTGTFVKGILVADERCCDKTITTVLQRYDAATETWKDIEVRETKRVPYEEQF